MKFQKVKYIFMLIASMFVSCNQNLNFDQINDFSVTPIVDIPLIFFTVNQTDFVINGFEITEVSDITSFNVLENQFIKDNLFKLEAGFEISNTFNRGFKMDFDFLDKSNTIVYSFEQLEISANQQNFTQKETISIAENPLFLSAVKMKITIHLLPAGTVLDPNVPVAFVLKSSGRLYIKT